MKKTIAERLSEVNEKFMRDEITKAETIELLRPLADEYNRIAKEKAAKYPMFAKNPRLVKPFVTKSHGAELK